MDRQPPPPELSLAVRDGSRRMTYAEIASVRGISLGSARRLVLRHHWPRLVGKRWTCQSDCPSDSDRKSRKNARKRGCAVTCEHELGQAGRLPLVSPACSARH